MSGSALKQPLDTIVYDENQRRTESFSYNPAQNLDDTIKMQQQRAKPAPASQLITKREQNDENGVFLRKQTRSGFFGMIYSKLQSRKTTSKFSHKIFFSI